MKRRQKTQDMIIKREKFQREQFYNLYPKNENQRLFLEAMKYDTVCVAEGVSGCGKTMLAIWHSAKKLHENSIKKIVLIRAYQPLAGRTIGLLPGDATSKLLPFYQQMVDYFDDFLGKARTEIMLKNNSIEICSLETIRGRSWNDAIIICDESQNLFVPEVQALVTRIGEGSQMIFCGDDSGLQTDVKNTMNGLSYLRKIVDRYEIEGLSFVNFKTEDICRSGITKDFVLAFEQEVVEDKYGTAIISLEDQLKQFKKGK